MTSCAHSTFGAPCNISRTGTSSSFGRFMLEYVTIGALGKTDKQRLACDRECMHCGRWARFTCVNYRGAYHGNETNRKWTFARWIKPPRYENPLPESATKTRH